MEIWQALSWGLPIIVIRFLARIYQIIYNQIKEL